LADQQRWEERLPDHHTMLLQGAGHFIQEDAWQEMVPAIRQFASSQAVAQPAFSM
jgi:haloalkane dehalogenase